MLDTLPPEIVGRIAGYLILESCRPPVSLLCASRTLHDAAAPSLNPNLYARVFRYHYDTAAAQRRLCSLGPSDSPYNIADPNAAAYPNRPRHPDSTDRQVTPEPLMPADFVAELRTRTVALERLARTPDGGELREEELWVVYLMLVENDGKNIRHLVRPLGPGPGVDIVSLIRRWHERTLQWTAQHPYPPQSNVDALAMWIAWLVDDFGHRSRRQVRALRPYVFAAHQYDLFFAPWTQPRVPVPERNNQHRAPPPLGPYASVHTPVNRACTVPAYGRTLTIAPPILAHAAMLRFFTSVELAADSSSPTTSNTAFDMAPADLRALPRPALSSARHDADFERLLACTDGNRSPGRALWAWRGVFTGCWEGTFTFLEFDAFRDMLSGHPAAIYSGPYGEQAQVWKLRETFIRPKPNTPNDGPGLPLRGPMINAGFPGDMRPFAPDAISGRAQGLSPEDATINDALARQLEALEGYESIPADEVEAALANAEPGDNLGLLVTGVGHSAWGRFIISGHVRVWDGLLYLVKEYSPFQRGKWLYRGYVLGDGAMVGRWRDTFTPEDYVGYEGTFMLNKRS